MSEEGKKLETISKVLYVTVEEVEWLRAWLRFPTSDVAMRIQEKLDRLVRTPCPNCNGVGREGRAFDGNLRDCGKCGGTGRKL